MSTGHRRSLENSGPRISGKHWSEKKRCAKMCENLARWRRLKIETLARRGVLAYVALRRWSASTGGALAARLSQERPASTNARKISKGLASSGLVKNTQTLIICVTITVRGLYSAEYITTAGCGRDEESKVCFSIENREDVGKILLKLHPIFINISRKYTNSFTFHPNL